MEDSYTYMYLVLFALCSTERDNEDKAHPVVVVDDTNAYLYTWLQVPKRLFFLQSKPIVS